MDQTTFAKLAHLGEQLEQTRSRLELAALLADFLRALAPEEIAVAVRMIIGQVFPEWDGRTLNVSWRQVEAVLAELTDASPAVQAEVAGQAVDGGEKVRLLLERARRRPPEAPPLTILEVFHIFEAMAQTAGRGSQARKEALVRELLGRMAAVEAKFVVKLIYQEMRHGVSEGIMLEGIAKAAGAKIGPVRRANQLWGDLGEVARVALLEGETALKQASLRLFQPLKPMLAQTSEDLGEVFQRYQGQVALEYKLDGARVQIHRQGERVQIYSRQLSDVTDSLPDVVERVRAGLAAQEAILDAEAVAVDAEGRPLPFQHLMRRFRRKHDLAANVAEIPVEIYLFDLLHVDGQTLIDAPYQARWTALERAAGEIKLAPRLLPKSVEEAQAFAQAADEAGHEGVMAKDVESRYTPGVRGKTWLKLKHFISLDLVIVAADWGYGRRHGWLSNYHLAARDAESGDYLVVGKTFKGLTDAEFDQMTRRLLALEQSRRGATVFVQPQVVVEVLFNEIQESRQYRSGLALRFARIFRLREDKAPGEADTLQMLRELYERQFQAKGAAPGFRR